MAGAEAPPVVLYSLYFNAPGENRYPADKAYKPVLDSLRQEFDVRVNDLPLTAENLKSVSVVLVANPNDKPSGTNRPPHHANEKDIGELVRFVEQGGGLIVMANQEGHNLEVNDFNQLLRHFGLQFTNVYTDAKKLVLRPSGPLPGGLRWAYYTGNQVLLDREHSARPFALVTNDLEQKPAKGTRDQAGVLMGAATPGRGRVVVVTDSGWIADWALNEQGVGGVALHGQDNREIFQRIVRWTAGR